MTNATPTAVRLAAATRIASAAAAVAENAAGAVIGTLATIDPDAGNSFTHTVSDSRFEVVGSTLKLKAGVALDYEIARALNITVTARDQGGLTKAQSFGLAVTNVNEGPTAVKLAGATVAENAAGAAIGTLTTIDPDAGNTFTYTVSDSRFEVVGATLKLKAGVSLDFEAASRVALTVTSTDQGGLSKAQAFSLTVTDANDLASIGGDATGAVAEDGTPTAGGTLTVADQDAGQATFQAITGAALVKTYGSFSFDAATGAWGYTLNNTAANVQALTAAQTVTDTLHVASLDGTARQDITVSIHGADDVPPHHVAAINLADIAAGTGGFKITGEHQYHNFGGAVASLGDMNGDGIPDLLFGTAADSNAGGSYAGAAYVVWGKADGTAVSLAGVAAGTGGFKMIGAHDYAVAGVAVASPGDMNGDGIPDMLVSAPQDSNSGLSYNGAAYVVWGKADGTGVSLADVAAGTGGFAINSAYDYGFIGASVASTGDMNGDGRPDLLLGAPNDSNTNGGYTGAAYVVWGKADGAAVSLADVAAGTGGFRIIGEHPGDHVGSAVASLGDLNGDGLRDMLVGGSHYDVIHGGASNLAYVVWGKADGTTVDLAAVAAGTGGFKITGAPTNDSISGFAATGLGDVNGDGRPDILLAEPYNSSSPAAAYVVWGKADGAPVDLAAVAAGTGGFEIRGEVDSNWSGGTAVASLGDLNGDGRADLMVSVYTDSNAGGQMAGAAYVVWGKADGTAIDLAAVAAGTGGFKILGEHDWRTAGNSVAAVGDMNGDGMRELLVTSTANTNAGGDYAGAAYVVFSQPDWHFAS